MKTDFINRLKKLLRLTDYELNYRKDFVEKYCPYGCKHFCDGSINKSANHKARTKKPPCEHMKDGECEVRLHLMYRDGK